MLEEVHAFIAAAIGGRDAWLFSSHVGTIPIAEVNVTLLLATAVRLVETPIDGSAICAWNAAASPDRGTIATAALGELIILMAATI